MSCEEPPPPELLEGIAQFNRGEYFEQHETLELLWRAERRDVLTRGPRYLAPFAPACRRVDVAALLRDAAAALREVERLGPSRLAEFDWSLAVRVRMVVSG